MENMLPTEDEFLEWVYNHGWLLVGYRSITENYTEMKFLAPSGRIILVMTNDDRVTLIQGVKSAE